jgi:hypothetical protein
MMDIIGYSVFVWFFFYLWNYSYISSKVKDWTYSKLHKYIVYSLSCAFCFCFHTTLILSLFSVVGFEVVFIAPVISLFINLIYNKLIL